MTDASPLDTSPLDQNPLEPVPTATEPPATEPPDAGTARAALRRAPESIGAMVIAASWGFGLLALGITPVGIAVIIVLALLAVGATILVVHNGSSALLLISAIYVALLAVSTVTALSLGPVGVAAAASSVVIYVDLIRLSFARRRTDALDDRVSVQTIGATALVALVSMLSIVAALALTGWNAGGDASRSWLWVPIATAVIVIPGLVLLIGSARKSGQYDKRRWTPGERMLPQPNVD